MARMGMGNATFEDMMLQARKQKRYFEVQRWVGRQLSNNVINSHSWDAYSQAVEQIRARASAEGVDVGLAVRAVAECIGV